MKKLARPTPKSPTHFEQVQVAVVKKIARVRPPAKPVADSRKLLVPTARLEPAVARSE
jgi:hypothetical protein